MAQREADFAGDADWQAEYAVMLVMVNDPSEAVRRYRTSLRLSPDHPQRAVELAMLLLERRDNNDLEEAWRWVSHASRLAPDAPAVLAGYSRLVIDCNRPAGETSSIPRVSDGVEVPGNRVLGEADSAARQAACFTPYHEAVDRVIARVEARHGGPAAVISMHSFTPVMDGYERPWHVGILWHEDGRMAVPVIAALAADPSISVGDNQPYSGRVPVPYSIPAHALPGDRPHVTVEIRQDLIDTHHGAEAWANIMAAAFAGPLADPAIYRAAEG